MNLSMNVKKVAATTLAVAVLFSGTFTTSLAAPVETGGKATVTNTDGDSIRVRKGPGTEHAQIAAARQGQVVTVLSGPTESGGVKWYMVETPAGKGWMMGQFLDGKEGKPVAAKAAPAIAKASELSGFARVANTGGDPIRVRSEASRKGKVLTSFVQDVNVEVKSGPIVDATGIVWYQVSANGVTGWMMAEYLAQAQASAKAANVTAPAKASSREALTAANNAAKAPVVAKPAIVVAAAPAASAAPPAPAILVAPIAPVAQPQAQVAAPAAPVAAPAQAAPRTGSARGAEPPAPQASSRGGSIVSIAMKYNGYRYRFGGASPSGFDCSGFIYYVLNKAGINVGRTMPTQIRSGARISSRDLQPGDLLFWSNTYKPGLSHAGIYIGNGKFIHAENESTGVRVSSMYTAYWASRFTAAVRPSR